jgi:hypothetical protein
MSEEIHSGVLGIRYNVGFATSKMCFATSEKPIWPYYFRFFKITLKRKARSAVKLR